MTTSHEDFARRLTQACDDLRTVIPPHGYGRQVFFARKLKVSPEAVRKWFAGESRPRIKAMTALASILNVDVAWLSFGVQPDMSSREKKLFTKNTEGVAYLALGLSMINGGACARPSDNDPRKEFVDYYMIINGEQVAVHTSLGREIADNQFEFVVPHQFDQVRNLGFVINSGSRFHMLDLRQELIEKHKEKKGGLWAVKITNKSGDYYSGRDQWPRLSNIGDLV